MRKLNVLIASVLWLLSSPAAFSQVSKEKMETRRIDALRLTRDAHKLSRQVNNLARQAQRTIAMQSAQADRILAAVPDNNKKFELEVKESLEHSETATPRRVVAEESKPVLQNYADLVSKYHAALAAYLQHRKEVQAHAAAFHEAAQQQQQQGSQPNSQPATIEVPSFTALPVRTQDACDAMQEAEASLHSQEESLNQAIQMMMNNRKTLSAVQYAGLWTQSEQQATSLQSGASAFDQSVVAKQQTITDNLHGKMQEAMRDGDYVLSHQVYGDEQRSSMLIHEEVKRATKHSQLSMQILNQLQSLSPYAGSSSSGSNPGNPNQFVEDDKSLAAEYAQVQALYQRVQEASPQFHK